MAGVLLLAATVIAGLALLPVAPPPPREQESAGIVPPLPAPPGEGFAIGMAVRIRNCSQPVEVTLVTNATAGYWRRRGARLPHWSRIAVTVPHADLASMRAGLGQLSTDLLKPMYATAPASPFIRNSRRWRAQGGMPVVSTEIREWQRHTESLVVQFRADWLRARGLGSCYLRLPGLTGTGSILAAQHVLGRATRDSGDSRRVVVGSRTTGYAQYAPGLAVGWGATTVLVADGAVDVGSSVPVSNQTREGYPAWICQTTPTSVSDRKHPVNGADLVPAERGRSGAFSRGYLARTQEGDCGAVVTITMANAGLTRDVWLLVFGALLGLGATLIVEPLFATLARHD